METSMNFSNTVSLVRDHNSTKSRDGDTSRLCKSHSETVPCFLSSNETYSNNCKSFVKDKLLRRNKSLDRYILEQNIHSEINQETRIPGCSKIYHYKEIPSSSKINYPDIILPPPAEKQSVYESLPPQVEYRNQNSTQVYPLFEYGSAPPLLFSNQENFWNSTKLDHLNADIAYNVNQLQNIAKKWSKVILEEDEKRNQIQKSETDHCKEKDIDEQKYRRPVVTGKPRPMFRSKTETRVSDSAEQPKRRLGFFIRKKSDLDTMRKQFSHLQTDSE